MFLVKSAFPFQEYSDGRDVEPGDYWARFLGVRPRPDMHRKGKNGEQLPMAIEWQWKIVCGKYSGKIVNRITGEQADMVNACGKMMDGLAGRQVSHNEQFNTNQYEGKLYRITVEPSRSNGEVVVVSKVDAVPYEPRLEPGDKSEQVRGMGYDGGGPSGCYPYPQSTATSDK